MSKLIPRTDCLNRIIAQKDKDLIKVITGIRRCGKSVLLLDIFYSYLISSGITKDRIITIQLDAIKNKKLLSGETLYNYVSNMMDHKNRYYILLDEIQLVDDFEDVLNGLKGEFDCDIYVTGSNSKMLSSDINTKFRGRNIEIKAFPLSFKEFHNYINRDIDTDFRDYILYGGMPYLIQEGDINSKIAYLNSVYSTVIIKDIIERHKIRNIQLFEAITDVLCSSIGSYITAKKIADTLKNSGFKTVDNETISNYLEYMCDAFLFYKVLRYDIKGREYLKTQNKYYIADLGLRNARLNFRQTEMTHIIENIVYLELLRRNYTVDIGKNNNNEVDFVVKDGIDTIYIQVCYSIEKDGVKERELKPFDSIRDSYRKVLITTDKNPLFNLGKGYTMLNLYDFLLSEDSLEK